MKINTKVFRKLIERVQPAVSSKSTLESLKLIYIEPVEGGLSAIGTDMNLVYCYQAEAEGTEGTPPFIVNGKRLIAVLRVIESEQIEVSTSENELRIKDGEDLICLDLLPASTYPKPEMPAFFPHSVNGKVIGQALKSSVIAASDDPDSDMFSCLNWMVKDSRGLLVANNGHFVAMAGFDASKLPEMDICLRRDVVERMLKQLIKLDEDVEVHLTETFLFMKAGDMIIAARIMDYDYWDCSGMILDEYGQTVTYDRERFVAALQKLKSVAGDRIHTAKMVFGKRAGTMRLKTTTTGLGRFGGVLKHEGEAIPETHTTVNAWYLAMAVEGIDGEQVQISSTENDTPALITGIGEEASDLRYIVFPIRV